VRRVSEHLWLWPLLALSLLGSLWALAGFGGWRWRRATAALQAELSATRTDTAPSVVRLEAVHALPAPVQRYLRLVLREGLALPHGLLLHQEGTFNMKTDGNGWKAFTAVQRVQLHRPGFVWDARITLLPGVEVRVHDSYRGGRGSLHAALWGAVPLTRLDGVDDLARAELMRWLAETPWYPSALLPGQGVRWQAVDARNADATVQDGDVQVTLRFHFDSDGLVDTVTAASRARLVGGVSRPAPWQGRFWNYALRHGQRVPLQGEVAWLLPGGAMPYWRGRVAALSLLPA
jgi:hypothetical protein